MHKSRLGGLIIDCNVDDLDNAAEFWSAALGYGIKRSDRPEDEGYRIFDVQGNDLDIEVQKVTHPSRVHIDIETDDIEAEAKRLENIGATRVKETHSWLVMEAPTGQRFCLVNPQRENFEEEANTWE